MNDERTHPPPNPTQANTFFRRALAAARAVVDDADRLLGLVEAATRKLDAVPNRGPISATLADAGALFRMLRAYARRTYTAIPWESLVLSVAAVLYFVSPIDLVPDWVPVLGYLDDAAVIGFVAWSVRSDLDKFREWEARPTRIPESDASA